MLHSLFKYNHNNHQKNKSNKNLIAVGILATPLMSLSSVAAPSIESLAFEDIRERFAPNFEMSGSSFMPGMGFIDFDNDTWVDIYVSNGFGKPNALYKNLGNGRYVDVAAAAGVDSLGFTTGVAVGDVNNDGFDDLYVASMSVLGDGVAQANGPDALYINNGDGTFRDVYAQSGIAESDTSTSVGFIDIDNDGFLDIVVGRFIDFDVFDRQANRTNPTVRSHLYRNNGDLTFTDVTEQAGIGEDFLTWSIANFDFDNDGDTDIILGHEQGPISIFSNDGLGHFTQIENTGDLHNYGAWMGLSVGDYNNDGLQDLYASNISDLWVTRDPSRPEIFVPPPETWDIPWPTLFRNNGDGTFTDVGEEAGVKIPTEFSWGTFFTDINNDGWQDIYLAQNLAPVGVIGDGPNGAGPGRLFLNQGDGTFIDVSEASGAANVDANGAWLDARGTAKADVNKDGKMDFYVVNTPQYPVGNLTDAIPGTGIGHLFVNTSTSNNNWLQLRLIGQNGNNLNAVGAKVELVALNKKSTLPTQYQQVVGGTSVYSANERLLHFGLADTKRAALKITWPNGKTQLVKRVKANQRITVVEGCDKPISEAKLEKFSNYQQAISLLCR